MRLLQGAFRYSGEFIKKYGLDLQDLIFKLNQAVSSQT